MGGKPNTMLAKSGATWSPFIDWIHIVLTAIFALVLIPMAYGDLLSGLLLVIVAYGLASFARPFVKKYAVKKTVLFDIHGVLLGGDIHLDVLTEMDGTRDLIQRLRKKYKVAAVTNMGPEMFQLWSRKWNFSQMYDYVYHSGGLKVKKPEAKIFEIVMKDLNTGPACTAFLDDVAENVDAAKKLGIHGIVFKDAKSAEAELKKMGFGP